VSKTTKSTAISAMAKTVGSQVRGRAMMSSTASTAKNLVTKEDEDARSIDLSDRSRHRGVSPRSTSWEHRYVQRRITLLLRRIAGQIQVDYAPQSCRVRATLGRHVDSPTLDT
jgi:hypothetical protein